MKKIIGLLLYLFAGILFAQQIDVTLSQGTEQSIVDKLAPKPGSPEVDANVMIKALFNEALNPMFAKQSVSLKRLTNEKTKTFFGFGFGKQKGKHSIQGNTTYDASTHMITFTPNKPLPVGFYEVSLRHLMKLKPGKNMLIKPIIYRFYVPEVINGFKLPPESDEKKNNETLLGIDFNDNGIRDDVERLIIVEEAKNPKFPKTQTAISLQFAWAWQKMIENPTLETRKYLENASACQEYFVNKHTRGMTFHEYRNWEKEHPDMLGVKLEDIIFNTKKRILQRFEFNRACSGNIFELKTPSIERCIINIDELGE